METCGIDPVPARTVFAAVRGGVCVLALLHDPSNTLAFRAVLSIRSRLERAMP